MRAQPLQARWYAKWCGWCGDTINRKRYPGGQLETRQALRKRKFCSRICSIQSINEERPKMAKESTFGMEYEPKPSWVECTHCRARRPPASLKDGRCAAWEVLHLAEVNGELSEYRENRCDELAKSREAK